MHDPTDYWHVTFTSTHTYFQKPTKISTAILTASYTQGQYKPATTAQSKGARTYTHRTASVEPRKASSKAQKPRKRTPPPHLPRNNNNSTPFSARPTTTPTLRTAIAPNRTKTSHAHQQAFQEWQLKLGQAHLKTILKMSKHGLLPLLPIHITENSATLTGSDCIHGKIATRPHQVTQNAANIGGSLSSDVCGPIKPTSTQNSKYFSPSCHSKDAPREALHTGMASARTPDRRGSHAQRHRQNIWQSSGRDTIHRGQCTPGHRFRSHNAGPRTEETDTVALERTTAPRTVPSQHT